MCAPQLQDSQAEHPQQLADRGEKEKAWKFSLLGTTELP